MQFAAEQCQKIKRLFEKFFISAAGRIFLDETSRQRRAAMPKSRCRKRLSRGGSFAETKGGDAEKRFPKKFSFAEKSF
ncbi:MAG: hypothetical protein J6D37_09325 [Clostridia bacterium]|nr:hypothetical protein [Clostridia bacterium]